MGVIELCEGVHTALRQASTQIPIGFCAKGLFALGDDDKSKFMVSLGAAPIQDDVIKILVIVVKSKQLHWYPCNPFMMTN